MATETVKEKLYLVGITIKSKEDYDKLMEIYSIKNDGFFFMGIDFKGLFEGYPEKDQYPCMVQYTVKSNPWFYPLSGQLLRLVNGGYHVHIELEEG